MIKLTGLNNKEFYLNCDLIEKLEVTPDTVITLTTGKKFVVLEPPEVIIRRIVEFRKQYMYYDSEVRNE
ncbi:flagellar FlbD family protein [Fonticella tunisiensis]|uniref:Flagellar protein FlbD n=1 Tax=Fonticella tunisiensis TaxID=1096341 RepID=A0A4R7K9A2_9CLOT|nr:flagellar FlbD family protein [Fonticella tunisiensis]TDT50604.1 flagellar protein FlbD [Fonticella tunisiensis]